nr:YeeE/YedE thiosulfate transporter family protein [uncultured Cetobacterium sp.]
MLDVAMVGFFLGILFGIALVYAGAANRFNILSMLKFEDLTLMKVILLAMGVSITLTYMSVLAGIIPLTHFSVKPMNLGVIAGAVIFGLGFGFIGLCPGTTIASLGRGYLKAIYVILGGLVGAIAFTFLYPIFKSIGLFENVLGGKTTLVLLSPNINSLTNFSTVFGVGIGIVFIVLSIIIKNKK